MLRDVKRILVIAAHPDDEILGVAGTAAKLALSNRVTVKVVYVASGITARYSQDQHQLAEVKNALDTLKEEARTALALIGCQSFIFLDYPDNALDTVSRMEISRRLKEIVTDFQPDTVFTHHHGDYNWDHGVVFDATLMACRPSPGEAYPRYLLSYEILSSTERAFQTASTVFLPTVYWDISETIDLKKKAMQAYRTEYRPYPHPRSVEGIEALAKKRGLEVGLEWAEAFQLIRCIV